MSDQNKIIDTDVTDEREIKSIRINEFLDILFDMVNEQFLEMNK